MAGNNNVFTEKLVSRIREEQLSRLRGIEVSALEKIDALFEWSIRRVYLKTSGDADQIRRTIANDADKVRHIMDWLVASVLEEAHWLSKVDALGRPGKVMKCGTIEALAKEADTWGKKRQSGRKKLVALDPREEQLFMDFGDGWRLVQLKTPSALDRESGYMQHCVGDGAYDAMLNDPGMGLLSLRDHRNEPHVTVEINLETNRLVQVWGKANTIPKQEYSEVMRPFFLRHGYWQKRRTGINHLLFDPQGGVHIVGELPEGLTVRAIENVNEELLEVLPTRITVESGISLSELDIRAHVRRGMSGMVVAGSADLSLTQLGVLPARHGFRGDIDLSGSDVQRIEDGFRCHGSLKVSENKKLACLPYRMVVARDLFIRDTPITALPEDLSVHGDLTVRGTEIRKIPKTVRVGGKVTYSRW
ncbi:hypothetical protein HFN89_03710 [Rhizobium laguerreae]|nr:hypothetical protein [Rhizobium laguerreae]